MRETLYLANLNRTRAPWRWSLFLMDRRFPRGLDWLYDTMDSVWLGPVLGDTSAAETFFRSEHDTR